MKLDDDMMQLASELDTGSFLAAAFAEGLGQLAPPPRHSAGTRAVAPPAGPQPRVRVSTECGSMPEGELSPRSDSTVSVARTEEADELAPPLVALSLDALAARRLTIDEDDASLVRGFGSARRLATFDAALADIAHAGATLVVISPLPQRLADKALTAAGVRRHFAHVLGTEEDAPRSGAHGSESGEARVLSRLLGPSRKPVAVVVADAGDQLFEAVRPPALTPPPSPLPSLSPPRPLTFPPSQHPASLHPAAFFVPQARAHGWEALIARKGGVSAEQCRALIGWAASWADAAGGGRLVYRADSPASASGHSVEGGGGWASVLQRRLGGSEAVSNEIVSTEGIR